MTWAHAVLGVIGLYAAVGAVFAAWFTARGIHRADPAARGSHPVFFVLIVPGLVALWPLMLGDRRAGEDRASNVGDPQ